MKKLLLFICSALIFVGCNGKKNDVQEDILQGQENQEIQNKQDLIDILSYSSVVDLNDESKFINHEINYSLSFDKGGFFIKVFETPSIDNVIYTLETNDKIDISNIVYVKDLDKNFIKVKVNSSIEGYIYISNNPYHDGFFEKIGTVEVDSKIIDVLKIEQSFLVSEGTKVKELPSNNAANLHQITHSEGGEYFDVFEITQDYEWVKVQCGDVFGWVPAKSLSRDIGGPTIVTPEAFIEFDLIYSNLI